MQSYQREFIQLCLQYQSLVFGDFTLKSGRRSPYFFNIGKIDSGRALAKLGSFYTQALQALDVHYDLLFGPAYKGIPIVASTAVALARDYQHDVPYAYDRKEPKQHGEGGGLVGAPIKGDVIIVDDVVTAGTAVRHSIDIIHNAGANVVAVVVGIDRQEEGKSKHRSALQELAEEYAIKTAAIINLDDLITYCESETDFHSQLECMQAYRAEYGLKV